jgi:hypothetical protein
MHPKLKVWACSLQELQCSWEHLLLCPVPHMLRTHGEITAGAYWSKVFHQQRSSFGLRDYMSTMKLPYCDFHFLT